MKFIVLLSATLAAAMISAQATTETPTTSAAAMTNANPEEAMAALFGDPTIVKATGFEIKRSEFDQLVTSAKARAAAGGQQWGPGAEVMILDQLINIQVLTQMTNADDVAAGTKASDEQYTNLVKQFPSQEAFDRQLKAVGMTADELRSKATREAVAEAALKRLLNVNVTEAEAKDYYDQHPAKFEQPELVHARHILLMTIDPSTGQPLSTNSIVAKRKQIEDLRKRILAGEDFATLAQKYSEDPGSKDNGGEPPVFSHGQMVAEFDSAAFALETNQLSEVVTTQYGFHLIKVLEKTPAKKIDFATADPEIKEGLAQLKMHQVAPDYIKKLRAEQHVEIVDADLKTLSDQIEAQAAAQAAAAGTETNK